VRQQAKRKQRHVTIKKWLKAGVSEEGKWQESKIGTPQGAVISPLLANIYLHYAFDLWVEVWRRKIARGDMIVVRYADDAELGFELKEVTFNIMPSPATQGALADFGNG
jgi:retron-type reverse transcriptase